MPKGGARSRSGPPKTPTALRVLRGVPDKKPLPQNEPISPDADLKPPSWLDAEGRKVWRQLAPIHHKMGLLKEADVEAFAHACAKLATARREQGTASRAFDQAERIMMRFGWTPSDRTKLAVEPVKDDPLEDWLRKKKA